MTYCRIARPAAALALLLVVACAPAARGPLATLSYPAPEGVGGRSLVVFLPGRQSTAASYADEGFIAAARRAGLAVDVTSVEARFGYYVRGTLTQRLHADVVEPARARGYEQVWLVGISLGGTGALWYDVDHPGAVTGVVALSPFLGKDDVGREITGAGGLAAWEPGEVVPGSDLRFLWTRLKAYGSAERTRGRVYLAYGLSDGFAPMNALLARSLPPDQVFTAPGGHDWDTWRGLWDRLLRDVLAPRLASARL